MISFISLITFKHPNILSFEINDIIDNCHSYQLALAISNVALLYVPRPTLRSPLRGESSSFMGLSCKLKNGSKCTPCDLGCQIMMGKSPRCKS